MDGIPTGTSAEKMEQPNPSGANDGSTAAAGHLEEVEGYEELDVDHHDLDNEDMLQRIFRNDPSIVGVNVYPSYLAEAIDWWRRAGTAIGGNTHVKSLCIDSFDDGYSDSASLESFCRGVANNRSIERLKINECDLITRDIFPALSPFFEHNSNLLSIVLDHSSLGSRRALSLASALAKCDKNTLKRMSLAAVDMDEQAMAEFIGSMSHHHGLVNLTLGHDDKMGRNGCTALANLINNPETKLQELSLSWCKNFDDECICILSHTLGSRTNTIRKLDLSSLSNMVRGDGSGRLITSAGWCAILAALCNSMCQLKELRLRHNELDDQCLVVLGHALAGNTKLKYLDISGSKTVTATGWRVFSECLQSPTSALEKLCIGGCSIADEGAMAMATTLMTNKTLKCVNISGNPSITPAGWRACFNLLKNSALSLEELNLDCNSIDDDGIATLVELLTHNNTLKVLNLGGCQSISAGGWQQMSTLVQRPSTALTHLYLGENINDEVIIRFSNALLNNSSLKALCFGGRIFDDTISARGWDALSAALCNTSSINSTHSSNHTLETLLYPREYPGEKPQNVSHLLNMNRNEDKREVARQKILEHHFRDPESDIRVFEDLEWKALPRAVEWIGRDNLGFSLLYHLSRSMATLFELNVKSGTKVVGGKRKLEF